MWPMGGSYNVTPNPSKLKMLASRFLFWITPRWLSRKYQVFMMRLIVKHHPAEVERQRREPAREMSWRLKSIGRPDRGAPVFEEAHLQESALSWRCDLFGNGEGLFHTRADCRASQVIARQKKARET